MHPRNDDYQLLPQSDDSTRQPARPSLVEMEEVVVEGDGRIDFTEKLPLETLVFIIHHLPKLQDVARIAQVNHACRNAVMSPHFSYETKALIYDFGHNVDELPILRPGYVRGTHAQLREFLTAQDSDQRRLSKLSRTLCIERCINHRDACGYYGIFAVISTFGMVIPLAAVLAFYGDFTTTMVVGMSAPTIYAGAASASFLCLRKFASRRDQERNVTIQRLHHNSLFAPQEFGVTVRFEPTQEHVEAAAQPRVEMITLAYPV